MSASAGKRASTTKSATQAKKQKSSKSSKTSALKNALQNAKAEDLLSWMKDGQLIEVTNEYTLSSVLAVLIENKILSVPVRDVQSGQYSGFVDMVDIAVAAVDIEESTGVLKQLEEEDPKTKGEMLADVDREDIEPAELEESIIMSKLEAKAISDISKRDAFVYVNADDTVLQAAQLLTNHHRIGIMQGDKLKGLVTQSGLLEYITEEHADIFQKIGGKTTLRELSLPESVISIREESRAIEGFKLMRDKGVSGLAVNGERGEFVDSMSVSDIMAWSEWLLCGQPIRFGNLSNLRKPVREFLLESRNQRDVSQHRNLAVTKRQKLADIVSEMQLQRVHRLFVVEKKKAVTLVNYDHIIRFLLQ